MLVLHQGGVDVLVILRNFTKFFTAQLYRKFYLHVDGVNSCNCRVFGGQCVSWYVIGPRVVR
jgi:hypothetical protein